MKEILSLCISNLSKKNLNNKKSKGFTIVELLVVIVVIGILASVTAISYTGVTQKAKVASLQANLNEAATQIKLFNVENGAYPMSVSTDCASNPTSITNLCVNSGVDSNFFVVQYSVPTINNFYLVAGYDDLIYSITGLDSPKKMSIAAGNSYISSIGGSGVERFTDVALLADGGFLATGSTTTYGAGSTDVLVVKFNSDGVAQWSRTWGGTSTETGAAVAVLGDGSFVITGTTGSFGAGASDIFFIKFDSVGNLLWSKTWGGVNSDVARHVLKTNDGGFIITGHTNNFGEGGFDSLLIKFDASGNLIWNKVWGGQYNQWGYYAYESSDGGYLVTANIDNSEEWGDIYLAKFDSNGNLLWDKIWGGDSEDNGFVVTETLDGGYLLAGDTSSYGMGDFDSVLIKYDYFGNIDWYKTWGGPGDDGTGGIVLSDDGSYYVIGFTSSFGYGDYDMFISKYSPENTLLWNKNIGKAGYDVASKIIKSIDGGYVIASSSTSYESNKDALLVKTKSDGSIENCNSDLCGYFTSSLTVPNAITYDYPAIVSTPVVTILNHNVVAGSPSMASTYIVNM